MSVVFILWEYFQNVLKFDKIKNIYQKLNVKKSSTKSSFAKHVLECINSIYFNIEKYLAI